MQRCMNRMRFSVQSAAQPSRQATPPLLHTAARGLRCCRASSRIRVCSRTSGAQASKQCRWSIQRHRCTRQSEWQGPSVGRTSSCLRCFKRTVSLILTRQCRGQAVGRTARVWKRTLLPTHVRADKRPLAAVQVALCLLRPRGPPGADTGIATRWHLPQTAMAMQAPSPKLTRRAKTPVLARQTAPMGGSTQQPWGAPKPSPPVTTSNQCTRQPRSMQR
mmetsp:Transcript_36453/g.86565  ORF Transcript_36453/g.86565 Transcript_36453/m.86565 type:complete len:219 (+) Transcript_36453:305-961(+)